MFESKKDLHSGLLSHIFFSRGFWFTVVYNMINWYIKKINPVGLGWVVGSFTGKNCEIVILVSLC